MDLRSIINADSSTAPPPAHPPPPSQFHPPQQQPQAPPPADYVRGNQGPYISPSSASSYQGFQGKPAQPPPLQPPSQTDFRSPTGSSYHSAQSPYQHTPTSSLSGGQYPFPQPQQHPPPQSPVGQGQYPPPYPQRDNYSSTPISGQSQHHYYPHPSPSPYTPSAATPGSAHPLPQQQRSHSSYSTTAPTSTQVPTPYTRRESPTLAGSHTYPQPQVQQQHQHSQPGTPLGPPLPHTRTPSGSQREQHSPYGHQRNQSGGSYGATPQNQPGSPTPHIPQGTARATGTPTGHGLAQSPLSDQERGGREYIAARERERSVSVSPKTMVPGQPRPDDAESKYIDQARFNRQVTPAKRKVEDTAFERNGRAIEQTMHPASPDALTLDRRDHGSPSSVNEITTNGRNGLHLADNHSMPPGSGAGGWRDPGSGHAQEQLRSDAILPSPTTQTITKELNPSDSRGPHSSGSSSTIAQNQPNQQPTTPQTTSSRQTPNPQPSPKGLSIQPPVSSLPPPPPPPNLATSNSSNRESLTMTAALGSASSPKQPPKKRPRYEEPPIFARKASRSTSSSPVMANRRQPAPVHGLASGVVVKQETRDSKRLISSQPPSQPLDPGSIRREPPNGHPHPTTNSITHTPQPLEYGTLGPWEPTITNVIPYEDITRLIGHFLFTQVVQREDVGAGPAGGIPGHGAQLEIEAKIGQLIDKNTGKRLRLPVMNECIISKDDPSLWINFKSSMTESQHKTLNQFLNEAVMKSQMPKMPLDPSQPQQKPRIPMTYVHTRERDSFYELPPHAQNTLPLSIRAQINNRNKVKVRVTTDQKSGKTLAKIIKARVADLDIHSPQTQFDWRISVNLEMGYEGEIEGLVEGGDGGNRADRNKDRMSYRHLAYQIDLTQVTPSDSTSKADKEHELEVEVSTAEIRKQGLLARDTGSSAYEELVKGFVDNVRVLVRAAQAP
ncbi:hypothetical protein FGG08_005140 [Glutinoglossum americanum]|uniref:mRNA-capping enzyme subunit beta n=1 Tax=Glutinoglossum americanum TaxID=1670608 RepID=A0A9P8I7U5_9PEZI|nr:hypothetical protein FGG08_005140 [Glutinoglossum americanum]